MRPKGNAAYLHGCQEGRPILGITGTNSAPSLEVEERVFNKMAMTVEVLVLLAQLLAIPSQWYHHLHALGARLLDSRRPYDSSQIIHSLESILIAIDHERILKHVRKIQNF